MSNTHCANKTNTEQALNGAFALGSEERQQLAIEALSKSYSIKTLASANGTSRKFVYAQKHKAKAAISEAFAKPTSDDEKILFMLPVTKSWLKQLTIALILVCHSSYQGVIEIFRDLLDSSISKGTIHNIIHTACNQAFRINESQDLSKVRVGAHDEIFQTGSPVLVGCDAESTYCYLLKDEKHRDGNTWGVHLLDLREKQNLKPEHSIADGGLGLRKGQADAWPDIPCHGDVFHALKPLLELVVYLENRAMDKLSAIESIQKKLNRPRRATDYEKHKVLRKELKATKEKAQKAIELADDVRILYQWLKQDILALVGPVYSERIKLFDFVVEMLSMRESLSPHRIRPVRIFLEKNCDELLAFSEQIDLQIKKLSQDFEVDSKDVYSIYQLEGEPLSSQQRWEKEAVLRNSLKEKFYPIESGIKEILKATIRASSVVENLNSRLRNYFTLRRMIGSDYLTLLQFFLNHRRFMRSEHASRVGKSPRELMTSKSHNHWLELLGFQRFKQAA